MKDIYHYKIKIDIYQFKKCTTESEDEDILCFFTQLTYEKRVCDVLLDNGVTVVLEFGQVLENENTPSS